ncbi:IgGFc-binding protein-like isoform X3 [Dreissena polymorpha]|uniref:IgGFc-binding protein-like isoform X3 n=1 Tax=Dreissena polymorpha TaxID=45954 RepID=UPI002265063D|nr:IgGFc-binding protein-like isoform X3 [Dreissena polymorpha]
MCGCNRRSMFGKLLIQQKSSWQWTYDSDKTTNMAYMSLGLTTVLVIIPAHFAYLFGRQFIFGIPETYSSPDYIRMYIASKYVSKVYMTAPGIGFNQNITTPAQTSTTVIIPGHVVATSTDYSNKVVYVEADQPVSVHVMVRNEHTSDGFLLLPISDDAIDFFVASYEPRERTSQFIIAALEDNTRIEVQLKTSAGAIPIGGGSYSTGQKVSFALGKLQTYLVQHEYDLTGTHITSSKPISVVSGNKCANVPHDVTACDYLAEQLLPVRFWQKEYLCAKLKTRRNNRLRVLSSKNDTSVHIGTTRVTLNEGECYEYVSSSDAVTSVISNHPVLVLQFSEGTSADSVIGDPSMITVPATEYQETEYFYETPTSLSYHHASITIKTDQATGLRIDGASIDRSDELRTTLNNIEFSIIRLTVTAGKHHIYHIDPGVSFGVIVYGFDTAESYGFPLGLSTNALSLKEIIGSSCSPTAWHLDIDMEKLRYRDPGSVATDIYFGENSCTGQYIGNHLIFDYDIESCLTTTKGISGNPLDVTTGANVFVKTFVLNVDWTVKMRLHSCYTEPTLNGHGARYYLINNGCEMDANTHFLSQTDHETRFVFQAFQMSGSDHRLYIKCDATLCDTSDMTSSQQCDQRPHCTKKK